MKYVAAMFIAMMIPLEMLARVPVVIFAFIFVRNPTLAAKTMRSYTYDLAKGLLDA